MNYFNGFSQKINNWVNSDNKNHDLEIFGLNSDQTAFFLHYFIQNGPNLFSQKNYLIVTPSPDDAEVICDKLKISVPSHKISLFTGHEYSPYGGHIASTASLINRFKVLSQLSQSAQNKNQIIVCDFEALLMKLPPQSFFLNNKFTLTESDIISPDELASKLVSLGFSSNITVEEPATFSKKGEIFDIFPIDHSPIRIHYFDDMIEAIYLIDTISQKTLKNHTLPHIEIMPAPGTLLNSEYILNLRENIPQPGIQFKAKHQNRKLIFQQIGDNQLFENYAAFIPLFFKETALLLDYFSNPPLILHCESQKINDHMIQWTEEIRSDFNSNSNQDDNESLLPSADCLYIHPHELEQKTTPQININELNIVTNLHSNIKTSLYFNFKTAKAYLFEFIDRNYDKFKFIKHIMSHIKENFEHSGYVIISTTNKNSIKELEYLFDLNQFGTDLKSRISFLPYNLSTGFYYEGEKTLIIAESDLFNTKVKKISHQTSKKIDLFAEQLSTLKEGDYVIHSKHGLGKYLGLKTMDIAGTNTDYLVIDYTENDKIYVPVYKMNLIQKQADSNANLKLASLRNNKFEQLKTKAKSSIKKLAFDLLKLQAQRQSGQAFVFSPPNHDFKEFELAFPFEETPDQSSAIEDVLQHMQKPYPMDHLVCGDVGFGKTEVAMRAGFKAVLDNKQVAFLCPTTILTLQHYNSFIKRFEKFPVRCEFLSRFKTAKETKEIKEKLKDGKIDIIIGTHKLLGKNIEFKDLGLVVVDEEQRFGVGHKEKLKLLKSNVDFLTLTATPIPRTLQLAFLGLRELSLIQTAPPKRQSIKSYLIKEDNPTLKAAIEKELKRGGQVFIVHNRVQDLDDYSAKIRELVPTATIISAHGQLSEKDLENRVSDFYAGKYQILISTTIIESGIDIPNANTMIIDRADRFGLAQLHQLRGRIGRSDKKAYCYFVIPKFTGIRTIAEKRLKTLQTYTEMGSGFNIASADLEIRGAGDILGASQSGHIEAVGLELYMELLKEAIADLRGEKKAFHQDIEIQTPFNSYIPNHYITDSSERLKYYKKLSNCSTQEELQELQSEIQDIFGLLNDEIKNLFIILECRILLKDFGLIRIQVAGSIISLNFDPKSLENNSVLRNSIVDFFIKRPKIYQLTPDYKVIYMGKNEINQDELVRFSHEVATQLRYK